jgi:thioredoxin reductase
MENLKVVIVGAGVAGLHAANQVHGCHIFIGGNIPTRGNYIEIPLNIPNGHEI